MINKRIGNLLLWISAAGLFAGCSIPGKTPQDLDDLPNAMPRNEPPSRTGNPKSYEVFGKTYYVMGTSEGYRERGLASWYGDAFHGKRTSSGVPFDMYAVSAAHKSLPIPTYVKVTHLKNGHSIVVRVNDRGPFVDGRIIDLSYAAARKLGMAEEGTAPVEVVALPPYQYLPDFAPINRALASTAPATGQRPLAPGFIPASYQPAAPAPADIPTVSSLSAMDPFFLQVGAFAERRNAELLQDRLMGRLRHAVRIDAAPDNLYRVRIGPLADAGEAERLMLQLTALGLDKPHVVFD